jgi:NAD(P)-dependent dehydrogenase (short-subunit alcohol dehydrogenase family)
VSRLNGKVAVVTGAGRGIGRAVALGLAAQGARVVVNDLGVAVDGSGADESPAQEVVRSIVEAGGEAVANGADVSDYDDAGKLIHSAIDTFGQLDILVNVAGILRKQMIFNITPEEWDAVIRVHLRGTFATTRHASAYWRELRQADASHRLINFTSDTGLYGGPGQPNYAAAKMGILGFTLSCGNALRKYGVTANAIAPVADTRMNENVQRNTTRYGDASRAPEDVANVVTYLASPDSSWCNGRVIHVAGKTVSLISNPVVVRQVTSQTPWDIDDLGATMKRVFSTFPQGAEGRYDHLTKK